MDPFENGFRVVDRGKILTSLALPSLKLALRSYFSTYRAMKSALHLFDGSVQEDEKTIDFNHSSAYCESAFETILHFHHFIEIALKELLAAVDPILAADLGVRSDGRLLYKLARRIRLTIEEVRALKSVEFVEALDRLCALIGQRGFPIERFGFFRVDKAWLLRLNTLRNRTWHRGTFVLRYPALEEVVGRHILPLVLRIVRVDPYRGHEAVWKYRPLSCRARPIEGIVREFRKGKVDLGKVAFLKELGRAAYSNPLSGVRFVQHWDEERRKRAERIARADSGLDGPGMEVRICPVCGCNSLVVFDDIDEVEDAASGRIRARRYNYKVSCTLCTFELQGLKNPRQYGIRVPNFWRAEWLRRINWKRLRERLRNP